MTTEDDFQAKLDTDKKDWQTRLVLADWLAERNDVRADGYRCIGLWRLAPMNVTSIDTETHKYKRSWEWERNTTGMMKNCNLKSYWFALLVCPCPRLLSIDLGSGIETFYCLEWNTRREAEDAAAVAFSKLPFAKQAEMIRDGIRYNGG